MPSPHPHLPLPKLNSTLPTLDKAKLHILTAYTLESLLFSALQASGADAKAHRIFPELARLKNYFGKVKAAEAAGEGKGAPGPSTKLDKDAAARFIRHGLSGNEKYDKERAERLAKERARAALKARQMAEKVNKKFDDDVESRVQEELGRKRKVEEGSDSDSSGEEEDTDDDKDQDSPAQVVNMDTVGSEEDHVDSENANFYGEDTDASAAAATPSKPSKIENKKKKDTKDTKKSSKRRKSDIKVIRNDAQPHKTRSKQPIAKRAPKNEDERPQELILPERGGEPKTRSEMFNQLLSGTFAEQKKEKKNTKDRSKKGKKA
ncbi:uncharacterized protein N0V89_001936 [Didymosphaeria variabile]|uniref:Exosome complex protein n=1 Tax=Didymosphaeria variabile TaxID=1932322 RepID=A0A9W8XR73_9PLEO|nr:uncharacterized protein N0V89_001936 [Didymosphaeria variabile]KAJ4357361.1 hypothetical protein N0V89_001936 [Didymosphaeria variabile]